MGKGEENSNNFHCKWLFNKNKSVFLHSFNFLSPYLIFDFFGRKHDRIDMYKK